MEIELEKNYYYTGVGIESWKNQLVTPVKKLDYKIGTNKDMSVYLCKDDNENFKKVMECNLSSKPLNYKHILVKDKGTDLSENVERFPTFKNGKYMLEYTWGMY